MSQEINIRIVRGNTIEIKTTTDVGTVRLGFNAGQALETAKVLNDLANTIVAKELLRKMRRKRQ
jgi:hypothetical protein